MNDQVFIQHRFTIENYSDALVMPLNEYEELSSEEIDKMKQERYTNYRKIIDNPIPQPEPTKESLQADIASIDEQQQILTAQKAELTAKVAVLQVVKK